MRNYDNYTPEINYKEDLPSTESISSGSDKKTGDKTSGRRRNVKKDNAKAPKKSASKSSPSVWNRIVNWFRSPSARILAGIFLGCLTIYLAISFCSYFSSCIVDQSKIAAAPIGGAKDIANPGGEGGARLSEFLINEGFGLAHS